MNFYKRNFSLKLRRKISSMSDLFLLIFLLGSVAAGYFVFRVAIVYVECHYPNFFNILFGSIYIIIIVVGIYTKNGAILTIVAAITFFAIIAIIIEYFTGSVGLIQEISKNIVSC